MKKVRLFAAAFTAVMTVQAVAFAAVVETQVGDTVTMDSVSVGPIASGEFRSAKNSEFDVVDENGDKALKMPSDATLAYVSFSSITTKKGSIRVKLPSVERGTTELFYYSNAFNAGYPGGTPITLKNGGAYVNDVSNGTKEICFIEDGTMSADVWYRVERVFDFRTERVNRQKAFVYDDEDNLIGESPWTVCGNIEPHPSYNNIFPTTYFKTAGYGADSGILLDDLRKYKLSVTDADLSLSFIEQEKKIRLEFSEEMNEETLNTDNVLLTVDNEDYTEDINYTVSAGETTSVFYIIYDKLPYSESFSVTVKTDVETADGWNIPNEKKQGFKTSPDKFVLTKCEIVDTDGKKVLKVGLQNDDTDTRRCIAMLVLKNESGVIASLKPLICEVLPGEAFLGQTDGIEAADGEKLEYFIFDNWFNMMSMQEN